MVTIGDPGHRRLVSILSGRAARAILVPLLTLCAIAAFIALASILGTAMAKPKGSQVLLAIEREFAQIHPPPEAELKGEVSESSKMSQAFMGADYTTPLRYEGLRAHYDSETARYGWSTCGEEPVRDWFSDLGGMTRKYCKGDLHAHLQYAGERAGYGWDFAFSVTWGLR